MILGIDHVGLAVAATGAAADTFTRLTGGPAGAVEALPEQGVRVCFVPGHWPATADPFSATRLELLEPTDPTTPVGRFLARRGEGMHHICFAVDDILAELARLERDGFELIDRTPRRGHGGLVAFLHPRSAHGVLVELVQRDPRGAPPTPAGVSAVGH
ncbi:MAG: VOC family protein [Chloroflexota bacterium]